MRVHLQQPAEDREAPRFVTLMLEPDLFGGWQLVRETGTVGGRSSEGGSSAAASSSGGAT